MIRTSLESVRSPLMLPPPMYPRSRSSSSISSSSTLVNVMPVIREEEDVAQRMDQCDAWYVGQLSKACDYIWAGARAVGRWLTE